MAIQKECAKFVRHMKMDLIIYGDKMDERCYMKRYRIFIYKRFQKTVSTTINTNELKKCFTFLFLDFEKVFFILF